MKSIVLATVAALAFGGLAEGDVKCDPLVSNSGVKVKVHEANPWPMIFWERSRLPEIMQWYELNEFGRAGEVGELPPLKWFVNPKERRAPVFFLLTMGDPAGLTKDQLPLETVFARHYSVVAMDVSRWPDAATRAAAAIRATDVIRRDPRVPTDAVIIAGEGEAATAAFWAMANCKGICGGAFKNEAAKRPISRSALFAACAPRPIEVGLDLSRDTAETYYRELVDASRAYPLFGISGLDISVWPGDVDYVNRGGKIGFHCLRGEHGLCRTDWMRWMDYFDWQGVRGLVEPLDAMPYEGFPDLLAKADGKKARTAKEWEAGCKPRIREFFGSQIYGKAPARPADMKFTLEQEEPVLDGLGFRRTVRVDFSGPLGKCSFHVYADLPAGAKTKAAPGFIWISYSPRAMRSDVDRRAILSRGYALVQFGIWEYAPDYGEFAPERRGWASRNVFGCYELESERRPDSWGCIAAWAWGASRVLDWMETQKELDARHVGVVGLSRGGKTALWTGASDERFAMVCPCCSGCMGPRLHRLSNPSRETFWLLRCIQHFWFCPNAEAWGDHEEEMPWDMNALVACVAPRLLVVTDGCYDGGSGPVGGFHSARLASPVWELYGFKGIATDVSMPRRPDTLVGTLDDPRQKVFFNYHLGGHATMTGDWNRFMDIADARGWRH